MGKYSTRARRKVLLWACDVTADSSPIYALDSTFLLHLLLNLSLKDCTYSTQVIFLCLACSLEQIAIISLYSIQEQEFITDKSVFTARYDVNL